MSVAAPIITTGRRLTVEVAGDPQPQGSTTTYVRGGKAHTTSANKQLRPWRDVVTWNARQALAGSRPFEGPVRLVVAFSLLRPAGHFGRRGLLPSAPPRPMGARKDLDKLVRAIGDALTDAGVWRDDGQVVEIRATKDYDERPGALIRVEALAPQVIRG